MRLFMNNEEEEQVALEMEVKSDDDRTHAMPSALRSYAQIEQSVGLAWKNVSYSVKDKNNKGQQKLLLNDISGYVKPGKVLCILGPSGSGKTTLLQVLSGLRKTTGGSVFYNGKDKTNTVLSDDIMGYAGNAAFIPQEDLLMGSLTVRESLLYAAKLKVPSSGSAQFSQSSLDLNMLVDNTVKYLGLTGCASTLIGNVFFKGISGGQKRRVSIGVELMGQPSLLFMDEITSGLDSTSSYNIMNVINLLAKKGHTIIITIHQPSSRIFDMMCKNDFGMLVLESGRTMYFGKANNLVPYLSENLHYKIPQYSNPCDYILDLVNRDFEENNNDSEKLYDDHNKNIKDSVEKTVDEINKSQSKINVKPKEKTNILHQTLVLLGRNFLNHLRNPAVYWVRIVMYSMLCLCLGTLYWDIGNDSKDERDRISILFFVAAFLTFMSVSGMPAFVEERSIYMRERMNNHYSTLSYCIANFLSSVPWIFLISLISSALIYFMIQSREGGDKFGIYLLNLFTALMVAESMMVAISALSSVFMVGLAMGAGLLGLYMIVCGFFLLPEKIPDAWKWVHHGVSFHTYSFKVFMYNEFHDFNEGQIDGNLVLEKFDMQDTDVRFCFIILAIMLVVYRIIFYLLLRFMNRKQN